MASLLEVLEAREAAARARVEGLRAEQEALSRLEITRQTVLEVLAGDGLPGQDAGGTGADPSADAGAGAAPPRVGVQVPVFGPEGDGRRLPVAYRDVVEVLADAGRPLRASQVCQALGKGAERGIGRGCGSGSSGWWRVAGWSRPLRGCSPVLPAWRPGWTARSRHRAGEGEQRGSPA